MNLTAESRTPVVFLAALHFGCGGFEEFRAIYPRNGTPPESVFLNTGDLDGLARFTGKHQSRHAYVAVATRRDTSNGRLENCLHLDVIVIGTNCGIRIASEALTLTWDNVDFLHNQLTVNAAFAKAGETRNVPLNSRAREVLMRLKASSRSQYVFSKHNGLPYKSLDKLFTRACEDAGLAGTGLTLHSLRHRFASRLVMSGADLRTVQVLGGWRDFSSVQGYGRPSPGQCIQALERIAGEFHNGIHNTQVSRDVVELAERRARM